MRVRSVEAILHRLSDEVCERDALAVKGGAEHSMEVLLMRIETGDGLVGYGESISYGVLHAVHAAVEKILAPMLRGSEVDGIAWAWPRGWATWPRTSL